MGDNNLEQRIAEVFWDKFQFHSENLTDIQKDQSLFEPEIGFKAVDLFVLYMELEKALNIKFDEKDVVESRFDTYNNILSSVKKHLLVMIQL